MSDYRRQSASANVCFAMLKDGRSCGRPADSQLQASRCQAHDRVSSGLNNTLGRYAVEQQYGELQGQTPMQALGAGTVSSHVNRHRRELRHRRITTVFFVILTLLSAIWVYLYESVSIPDVNARPFSAGSEDVPDCMFDRYTLINGTGYYQYIDGACVPEVCILWIETPDQNGTFKNDTATPTPCALYPCSPPLAHIPDRQDPGGLLSSLENMIAAIGRLVSQQSYNVFTAIYAIFSKVYSVLNNAWIGDRVRLCLSIVVSMAVGCVLATFVERRIATCQCR